MVIAEERFVSGSDPCQARAVRMARECRGLVVHGPPGTGKSQTITNIIGDHLARGQRVLVVCDKRTALDVVFNRLSHMGLGNLCALVHDPRRDHRELYKSIRKQLDELDAARIDAKAESKLAKVDGELKIIHDELTRYRDALIRRPGEHSFNFHELVGEWLSLADFARTQVAVEGASLATLDTYANAVVEVLKRGEAVAYGVNPWVAAAGIPLGDFLAQPMDKIRAAAATCEEATRAADTTLDPIIPPFAGGVALAQQAEARTALAVALPGIIASTEKSVLARWAGEPGDGLARAQRKLEEADAFIKTFRSGPLDAELLDNVRVEQLDPADRRIPPSEAGGLSGHCQEMVCLSSPAGEIGSGEGDQRIWPDAQRRQRRAGAEVPQCIAGPDQAVEPGPRAAADRAAAFQPASPRKPGRASLPDDALEQALKSHVVAIELMQKVRADVGLTGLADRIAGALMKTDGAGELIEGLRQSAARAGALEKLETTTAGSRLFEAKWLADAAASFRAGQVSASRSLRPAARRWRRWKACCASARGLASCRSSCAAPWRR